MSPIQLHGRLEVVDLLLQGADTQSVLDRVCQLVESQGTGFRGCILLADSGGSYFNGCAAPSFPLEFREAITRVPVAEQGALCGEAAWSRSRLVFQSVFHQPELEALYSLFQRADVEAYACEPIMDDSDRLLGTFAMFLDRGHRFGEADLRFLESGSDLTRFTLQRARLLQRHRLFERAYTTTDVAVCVCDMRQAQAPIQMVNASLCRLLGGSEPDFQGRSLFRVLDKAAELLQQAERCGEIMAVTVCRRLDESPLPCEVKLLAVADDYGHASHILVTIVDLAHKIEFNQAQKESEARFRRIFEEVPHVAVRGCAADGTVRFWNSASERILGYSSGEAIGSNFPRRVESSYCSSNEYELQRKDGKPVPVFGTSVAISSPGVGLEVYTLEIDLSALREAEKERIQLLQLLSHAQKLEALGQLTGGIAHDFNNVLATILGNLQLARVEFSPCLLDEIQVAAERAHELIKSMLTYSRPHAATQATTLLQEPIRDVCRILASVIPSSVQLNLNLDPTTPAARLDPLELHQILANLVINSRDALQGRGTVEVGLGYLNLEGEVVCSSCHRPVRGPHVELWVRDNGPGIDDSIRGRLFAPFFTTKGASKGNGLGLAVLHRLVHERGGHVVVGPGPGARFGILLQPSTESVPQAPRPIPEIDLQHLVMVIDDEPMLARMLGKLLKTQGYQALVFTDSALAWAEFAANPQGYAAVITDQTMPGRTGDEFARDALALRPDLPILLCTGFSEQIDAQTALAMGIRYFLQKPVKPTTLFEALASVVQPAGAAHP